MADEKVMQLIPENSPDGFSKNIAEIVEHHRKDNIACLMICYRRRDDGGTRTFFLNGDDLYMFKTLVRLEHDLLGLCEAGAEIYDYGDEEDN